MTPQDGKINGSVQPAPNIDAIVRKFPRAKGENRSCIICLAGRPSLVHNISTCRASLCGRDNVWPWLTELSSAVLFHAFPLDYFYGSIAHKTGRHAHTTIQDSSMFKVWVRKTVNHRQAGAVKDL